MQEYDRDKVRNVALIAPHGAGKTSISEAMLYLSGATEKLGSVDDSTSVLDYETEEKNRKMSINSHVAFLEKDGYSLNLVDTPGYSNFMFDTQNALKIVDGTVLLASAEAGTKGQITKFWKMALDAEIPRLIFINKLDRERSSFESALESLKDNLDVRPVPVTIPIGKESDFTGVVDLVEMKAYTYGDNGNPRSGTVPEELNQQVTEWRVRLVESVAEMSDDLLERYLEGESFDNELIYEKLREGVINSSILPVLVGSATKLIGVDLLMGAISRYLPSPSERPSVHGENSNGQTVERIPSPDGPASAYVFKTISDPYAGKISIFRVFSGKIDSDSTFYNSTKKSREKLGQLSRIIGKKQFPAGDAWFGDIVTANKLKETETGDTLSDESNPIVIPPVEFPKAALSYAIKPRTRKDEDKLMTSLNRIREEDPTIQFRLDEETKEFLLSGTGQTHVEITVDRLKNTYGVDVDLTTPRVPYRETIKGTSEAEGKYIKQTGGRGQYGDAWVRVEPLPRGGGYEFVDNIVGGAIPRNFIPSVEKGIMEAMKKGVVAEYPVVDVKVTLFDGKHHPVDSSDIAFQIAGSMGFKRAMEQARPYLLEPIMKMEIVAPEDSMGDVIGDISSRRGKVSGVESRSGAPIIKALVPMAEVLTYSPELRSITSGRGSFTMEFSHYEELPGHLASKVVEETKFGEESDG